jgi:hypothetical protein
MNTIESQRGRYLLKITQSGPQIIEKRKSLSLSMIEIKHVKAQE